MFATRKIPPSPVHSAVVSELLSEKGLTQKNPAAWAELRAISRERDSDIFYQNLEFSF